LEEKERDTMLDKSETKWDMMDADYKTQMEQVEDEYKIDDVDIKLDTGKNNLEYNL